MKKEVKKLLAYLLALAIVLTSVFTGQIVTKTTVKAATLENDGTEITAESEAPVEITTNAEGQTVYTLTGDVTNGLKITLAAGETVILDVVAIRKALDNALVVADDRHGRLIDKSDLKTAMKYWHSQASRLGLTGPYSPHSLRYAWAQDAIRHYLAQGFCEKEALAMTAMDLGHGDGRGRYVAQVYGRRD